MSITITGVVKNGVVVPMASPPEGAQVEIRLSELQMEKVEFPAKSGQGVKVYSDCSYSAGETYPSEECRRWLL